MCKMELKYHYDHQWHKCSRWNLRAVERERGWRWNPLLASPSDEEVCVTWEISKNQTLPQPDIKLNLRLDIVCPRRAAHTSEMLFWPLSTASGHRQYKKLKIAIKTRFGSSLDYI